MTNQIAATAPRNILIVRASAIGDVLMASPVARALRDAYPDAHIAWLVQPLSAPMVRANPYVDEIIDHPIQQLRQLLKRGKLVDFLREASKFRRALRDRRFDLVVDLHGLFKCALVSRWTDAPRRIGPRNARKLSGLWYTDQVPWITTPTRLAEKYMALLQPLGLDGGSRDLVLQPTDADRDAAQAFLAAQDITPATPYAACCIASSRPQKDWPFAHWRELASLLWERAGLRTVLIGGPEQRAMADQLCEEATAPVVSAVGKTSLLQSAAIVQMAAGVIGVDTGLTYAGLPVGRPTVAIYGSTPYGWLAEEPGVAVACRPLPCSPCRKRPSCTDYPCMRAVTPDDVVRLLAELRDTQAVSSL